MEETLAILGGTPVLATPLPETNTIGAEEKAAVNRVMDSGVLSGFVGRAGDWFYGGPEVRAFEAAFAQTFGVAHAVSFNSATTALEAAVAALRLPPGSEIIVPPHTMTASVTAIIVNNCVPVFADLDPQTFCLDPESVRARITDKTKAIMAVNLFGGSPDYTALLQIAKEHDLKIIEDTAQAAGGTYNNQYLGTIGDMGIFSFNFHKTIQAGEGGVLVTNNKDLAWRAQLKRNHGENITDDLDQHDDHMIGSNYRLTELHAAIASEQTKKLSTLNTARIDLANYLTEQLRNIPGITPYECPKNLVHVYYVYPIKFNAEVFGVSRELFVKAMKAEGFALGVGYVKPIYLLNIFQDDPLYRDWVHLKKERYASGICPVAEQLHISELLTTAICRWPLTHEHIDLFVSAVKKVWTGREALKEFST